MREIPEIFMPDSGDNKLKEILVEEHKRFDIFWYHWPHDGDIFSRQFVREEDYKNSSKVSCKNIPGRRFETCRRSSGIPQSNG